MSSPFAQYANITVLFQLPTGIDAINALGSPALGTQSLIAIACANRQRQRRQEHAESLQDGELSRLFYQGFWVQPFPRAPQALQAEQIGKAYVWRIVPGQFRLPAAGWPNEASYQAFVRANMAQIVAEGDFVLAPTPAGPYGVESKTGDVFAGYLLTQVVWADAV